MAAAIIVCALASGGCEFESDSPAADDDAPVETRQRAEDELEPPSGSSSPRKARAKTVRVARVLDGDTLDLRNGKRIRLVQIDAPEGGGECYGSDAGNVLKRILPAGTRVALERDRTLDDVDRYGRLLRYVHKGRTNVNLMLVRRGAASVWFFDGDRGRYADRLLAAARKARAAGRGAWGECRAKLDPSDEFDTRPRRPIPPPPGPGGGGRGGKCMAGYSPCLPIRSDLDCDEIRRMGKAPVQVTGNDPYEIDGDNDKVGCEPTS